MTSLMSAFLTLLLICMAAGSYLGDLPGLVIGGLVACVLAGAAVWAIGGM